MLNWEEKFHSTSKFLKNKNFINFNFYNWIDSIIISIWTTFPFQWSSLYIEKFYSRICGQVREEENGISTKKFLLFLENICKKLKKESMLNFEKFRFELVEEVLIIYKKK